MRGRGQKFIFLVLLTVGLISCKEEEEVSFANPTQIDLYFPLSDFLQESIDKLGSTEVVKEIHFNDETETVDFTMDSIVWRQELDFFFQADINKAALATSYDTKEEPGLTVHQLKPNVDGNIKTIEIRKQSGKVVEISILSVVDNLFYSSSVEGLVKMDNREKISAYKLSGNQKVWFLSATNLHVEGKVE